VSKLANSGKGGGQRSVIQETLNVLRITIHEVLEVLQVNTTKTWVKPGVLGTLVQALGMVSSKKIIKIDETFILVIIHMIIKYK